MGKFKKFLAVILVVALVGAGSAGGLMYMKKANEKEVMVTKVSGLDSGSYYMADQYLNGNVTTNVSQNITLDKDMIIEELYVQQGDSVKVGDKLISFDMTLVEMELNIARLKQTRLKQQLAKAEKRLNSLLNGGPIDEVNADNLDGTDDLYDYNGTNGDDMNGDDMVMAGDGLGTWLAAARPVLLAAVFSDSFIDGDDTSQEPDQEDPPVQDPQQEESPAQEPPSISFQDPSVGDFSANEPSIDSPGNDFGSGEDDAPTPTPIPTPELPPDVDYFNPYPSTGNSPFSDGEVTFCEKLDYDTVPYSGKGTEEEPYLFLCNSKEGGVPATGAFFNRMAGYSKDGKTIERQGGYWFLIEFHQDDQVMDLMDRKQSCIGYYLIDGSLLKEPANPNALMQFTLEGASQYEEELPPDDGGGSSGDTTPSMSRAEAIKLQKQRITSLKLDIQESEIDIHKLEKKVSRQMVYSRIDGVVATVGDPVTGNSDGNAFITVKSKDGFYVKGTVSELMLDQMEEGTILNCQSWEKGMFTAEVIEVADYPLSEGGYYGDGNPNTSYYTFSATITDPTLEFDDMDWLNITLDNSGQQTKGLVLSKAFVRTENGVKYVYKDDNGVLKKQTVSGMPVDNGYSVLVTEGLTGEDKIAFPYSKYAKEGIKTKEVKLEEFYGY